MKKTIDARGLSCPQPVIKTLSAIKKGDAAELVVIVDTDTAKENVSRAARSQGWTVADPEPQDGGYAITIRRDE